MRATMDREDQEDLAELDDYDSLHGGHRPSRDLILSSSTILTIFFGLVLLCGLFFALGYTLGRRAPSDASIVQPAAPQPEAVQAASFHPKPSAAAQLATPEPAPPTPADQTQITQPASTESALPASQPAPEPVAATPEVKPALPALKLASAEKPAATPAPATTPILVQIAAVSNPADADVLIRALRKRGYSVNVRREPTDSLIHVQIGPFSTKAEAAAMRQKLLSDGYNAILK